MARESDNLEIVKRWAADALLATAFLTRLPVPLIGADNKPPLADVAWSFPLVGLLVGGAGGLALLIGFQFGQHPLVCGLFAIGAQVLLTGALHEDGLADVADGFGGGDAIADKLRIMRDSQVGSYGVLALVFSIAVRAGALAGMTTPSGAALALIAAGAVSRAMVVGVMAQMELARNDGLGASAGKVSSEAMLVAIGLAAVAAFLLLGAGGWIVLGLAATAALAMGVLAKRQIGGYSGDVLGAVQQVSEAAVLLAVVALI